MHEVVGCGAPRTKEATGTSSFVQRAQRYTQMREFLLRKTSKRDGVRHIVGVEYCADRADVARQVTQGL